MKRSFLLLLVALPTLLFAQKNPNFSLKGKIGTLNAPARAYLIYEQDGKNVTDSTTITNGAFSFRGILTEPASAFVVISPAGLSLSAMKKSRERIDALDLFVESANIVLSPVDTIAQATISGSKLNDENKQLKDLVAPFVARAKEVNDEFHAANEAQQLNPNFQDAIQAKSKIIQEEQTAALKAFIIAHPQSYLSITLIQGLVRSGMSILSIEDLYNGLAPSVKQTWIGNSFGAAIKELKLTAVGSPAPDFTQPDVNGTPVTLSSLKGKYVLLDFWASWYAPSRLDNARINRAFVKYKDKNFTVMGVALDKPETKDAWLKAIKDDGIADWVQTSDLNFWNNAAGQLYSIGFIPANFLIDPSGKIIGKNLKGAELDAKLLEIFKM